MEAAAREQLKKEKNFMVIEICVFNLLASEIVRRGSRLLPMVKGTFLPSFIIPNRLIGLLKSKRWKRSIERAA